MNKSEFNKSMKALIFKKSMETFIDDLEGLIKECVMCMAEYETTDEEPVNPIYAYFDGQKKAYEHVVQNVKTMLNEVNFIKNETDKLTMASEEGTENEGE